MPGCLLDVCNYKYLRMVMVTYLQSYGLLSALLDYRGMCRWVLKYYKWTVPVPDLDRNRCLIWASDHQ